MTNSLIVIVRLASLPIHLFSAKVIKKNQNSTLHEVLFDVGKYFLTQLTVHLYWCNNIVALCRQSTCIRADLALFLSASPTVASNQ